MLVMELTGITLFCVNLLIGGSLSQNTNGRGGNDNDLELHPQNGFFNNLFEPEWGAVGGELLRTSFPAYSDQVFQLAGSGRPNPLDISQIINIADSGKGSVRMRTAMLAFFGQLVVDEIVDSRRPGCPPEYENIPIPDGHLYRNKAEEMVFQRNSYNQRTGDSPNEPRQQQNGVTPYLDAGFLYGTTRFWTDSIREFRGGRLMADDTGADITASFPAINNIRLPLSNPPVPRDHSLKEARRFFRVGNTRGHENPFLLALQIIWFRWHNKVAGDLASRGWDDERLFDETRKRVIAHFQKIVMKDWLPSFLEINGSASAAIIQPFSAYNPRVHPGITQEFATAAMRFGHTTVPAGVWPLSSSCNITMSTGLGVDGQEQMVSGIRLCNTYWNSQDMVRSNFDSIVRGMMYTLSKNESPGYVPDLREYLYGPLQFSRQDLAAVDVQRGRDHGLPDYNTVREAYGLPQVARWEEINVNLSRIIQKAKSLYGNTTVPSNLDVLTGGLLETTDDGPGVLFKKIIINQFTRLRDGDRMWYENTRNGLFTVEEIAEINRITLGDIIGNTTTVSQNDILTNVFICRGGSLSCACLDPPSVDNRNDSRFEVCTPLRTYDFFTGSEASFAVSLVALGLTIPGSIIILYMLVKRRQKESKTNKARQSMKMKTGNPDKFSGEEWLGPFSGCRNVIVEFNRQRKKISVSDLRGKSLRFIDLRLTEKVSIKLSYDKALDIILVRFPGEVDLILRFCHLAERQGFSQAAQRFMEELGIQVEKQEQPEQVILRHSNNKDDRQKLLDKFFRVVCLQALKQDPTEETLDLDDFSANDVVKVKLTRTEFADSLGLQPSSIFVRNVFLLADRNNDGFLSFREFLDLFATFASGSADDKAKLLFNIYDIRRQGYLTRNDFFKMIRSLLDLSDAGLNNDQVTELMDVMFREAGIPNKDKMTFEEFKKVFASKEYETTLQSASLAGAGTTVGKHTKTAEGLKGKRNTFLQSYRVKGQMGKKLARQKSQVRVPVEKKTYPRSRLGQQWYEFSRFVQYYQLQIFWVTLYTLVCVGIFVERAYYYAVGREHAGLRRLSGAWTTAMIRGSASVIMFTYASLLVTMSRNTITLLRETFLHRFIPFDSNVAFHKFVAVVAMIATIVHIVFHCINLYCMTTQPPGDISCLFREYFRASHILATFHYWAYETITGLAGILVTVVIFVMYVFATQYARRHVFTAFWFTHSFYIIAYILTIFHGIGRLVQAPLFPWFLMGPLILFILDKLASVSRNKVEICVKKASLLPSGVIELVFRRPSTFQYRSGQWVRIACLKLGKNEYHPFTLTSAPHEENLSLHIRAVGPWTTNLRKVYDPNTLGIRPNPKLYLDGPFGEGHQDWYTFDVAVLVGGGIGVTPFASILKDIAFRSSSGVKILCQKVYFLWVTRSQRQFEWLIDIIRDVENKDISNVVSVHIFVTQFQHKFDLRTTMLYICERHFQKVEGRSLFTGLKAKTHFGRPQFKDFLQSLQYEHPQVQRVGVFSCGPGPMTSSVETACSQLNKQKGPSYCHHFENF